MVYRTGPAQTELYTYRRWLKAGNVQKLYHPGSKNKGADQLLSSAPLGSHMQFVGFLMRRLKRDVRHLKMVCKILFTDEHEKAIASIF